MKIFGRKFALADNFRLCIQDHTNFQKIALYLLMMISRCTLYIFFFLFYFNLHTHLILKHVAHIYLRRCSTICHTRKKLGRINFSQSGSLFIWRSPPLSTFSFPWNAERLDISFEKWGEIWFQMKKKRKSKWVISGSFFPGNEISLFIPYFGRGGRGVASHYTWFWKVSTF